MGRTRAREVPAMEIIEIHVTCPDADTAGTIARALVEERLAACANVVPHMVSTYWWEGELETEDEVSLLLKTRRDLFDSVATKVASLHPYDVPAILGQSIDHANEPYAAWIYAETTGVP